MAAAVLPIISAAIPIATALEPLVVKIVHDLEAIFKPGSGATKKSVAVQQLTAAGIGLVGTQQAIGPVPDEAALGEMVQKAVDAGKAAGTLVGPTVPLGSPLPSVTLVPGPAVASVTDAVAISIAALQDFAKWRAAMPASLVVKP